MPYFINFLIQFFLQVFTLKFYEKLLTFQDNLFNYKGHYYYKIKRELDLIHA